MRSFILILSFVIFCIELNGQANIENLAGQVSFVSTKNVYVKFGSTQSISAGDTLYTISNGKTTAVLIVNSLSSTSCVCTVISSTALTVADKVIAKTKVAKTKETANEPVIANDLVLPIAAAPVIMDTASLKQPVVSDKPKQLIRGSISAYSYSDFSNTGADYSQRFRYTLSLNARNIGNSKISFDNYMSFRHKLGEWSTVQNNLFNALKIYSLCLTYDANKTTQISVGRKINNNISSIGAMDGLQVQKTFNRFSLGAVAGFRPDYETYGFNTSLFQYGGYAAYSSKNTSFVNESSVAFMQQMNGSKTDRRFLYFQHSNTFIKNLYFLGTFEVDLYQLKIDSLGNETPTNTFNPTGLYLSLRYRLSQKLSVSGSYDARKNVMYYETYKSSIDQMLENELRQGFRLNANYRITRDLSFGLQGGYRYMKSDPHPSTNVYSYLTYSQIPFLKLSATISGSYLQTSYINGVVGGINISRDFFKGKVQTGLGYRYVDNQIPENLTNLRQHMAEFNFSWQFYKKMYLSVNYEGTFENQYRYNMVYAQIRKRF
jgi:hypothetical protein